MCNSFTLETFLNNSVYRIITRTKFDMLGLSFNIVNQVLKFHIHTPLICIVDLIQLLYGELHWT